MMDVCVFRDRWYHRAADRLPFRIGPLWRSRRLRAAVRRVDQAGGGILRIAAGAYTLGSALQSSERVIIREHLPAPAPEPAP